MKAPFNAASDFQFMTILFNSRLQVLADNQDGRDRVFVLSWIISLSHLVSAFVLGTSTSNPTEPFGWIPKSSSPCGELMKGWAAMTSAITSVRTRNVLNRGIRGEFIVGESLAAWQLGENKLFYPDLLRPLGKRFKKPKVAPVRRNLEWWCECVITCSMEGTACRSIAWVED